MPIPPSAAVPAGPQAVHAQAVHDFDASLLPSTSSANSNLYLSFKTGEIIKIHVRDATGWWDGEITSTSSEGARDAPPGRAVRRGWFPSNYIREIEWNGSHHRADSSMSFVSQSPRTATRDAVSHSRNTSVTSYQSHASQTSFSTAVSHTMASPKNDLEPLPEAFQTVIQPIVQALTLLDSAIHNNHKSHIQPSTACVISSIRASLAQTDCLSKDSTALVSSPALAKERKTVLVELSKLVSCARAASGSNDPDSVSHTQEDSDVQELEELARSARGVFASVTRFLHTANQCGVEVNLTKQEGGVSMSASSSSSGHVASASHQFTPVTRVKASPGGNKRLQETFKRRVASIGDLRAAKQAQRSASPPPLPSSSYSGHYSNHSHGRAPSQITTPMSSVFSTRSDMSSPTSARSFHERRVQGSMDSVFSHMSTVASSEDPHPSWEERMATPAPQTTPSTPSHPRAFDSIATIHEAIGSAEDALLSIIAAFIGHIHSHHIGSHPSSHAGLIEMTRETIDSVRDVLTIVESVGRTAGIRQKRPREVEALRVAKDLLYEVAGKLVESAEVVAHAPFAEVSEESYDKEKADLLQTATGTLRAGTECVRLVKTCVPEEDETLKFDSTPRPSGPAVDSQFTPRLKSDHPIQQPRDKTVGIRGVHTLSGLHRKATSLDHLQKRYQEDGSLVVPMEHDEQGQKDEYEEEEVIDDEKEDDLTMRPVPGGLSFPQTPSIKTSDHEYHFTPRRPSHELLRGYSETGRTGPRLRSSSLSSPHSPRIDFEHGHRSPSKSADLDKFPSQDNSIPNTESWQPQAAAARSSVYRSATSSATMDQPSTDMNAQATPLSQGLREKYPKSALRVNIPARSVSLQMADLNIAEIGNTLKPPTMTRPGPVRSMTSVPTPVGDISMLVKSHDYDPTEITFNPDGNLVGASLSVLVEKMTPHDGPVDPTFSDTFWFTFRLFTTSSKLLDELISRYHLPFPDLVSLGEKEETIWMDCKILPLRLRIFNLLRSWLELHWRPEADDEILHDLLRFAKTDVSVSLPAMGPRLVLLIERKMEVPRSAVSSNGSFPLRSSSDRTPSSTISLHPPAASSSGLPPTPIISKNLHTILRKSNGSININITEFDILELARQLTIIVSKMFRAVVPEDLLMTGRKTIKELKALSTHSNQVTGWVADSILNEGDAKKRAGLLKFFIKLADKCLMINNFFTLFAVLAGLNSSTILRLKRTWDALSAKYHIMIDRLRGVIEHTKNHASYRARLRDAPTPCLPFLGLILTDITFTSDGNANTRQSNTAPDTALINYDKYAKLGKIAIDFRRYQEPFNYHELEAVQVFLDKVLTERGSGSIDALYRKSLMLEPRQVSEKLRSNVEKPSWLSVKI